MSISVYVLKSLTNSKQYVGISNNLARRLREHATGTTKAGQILGEFKVIYQEELPSYLSARKREKFLKSGQPGKNRRCC